MATSAGAEAAIGGPDAMRVGVDRLGMVEKAQFVFEGRDYCFYLDGWHGPGWYWCGYRWRRGLGWGGHQGWRGWEWREHRREEFREHRGREEFRRGREFERLERREERRERRY
jgi:hypothetical protein